MTTARIIRVMKRDGGFERFNEAKLAGSMWAAMKGREGGHEDARELARAVTCHLHRTGQSCITTKAVFEMTLKVLRRVRLWEVARAMEMARQRRRAGRKLLRVLHDGGHMTLWDKSWLATLAAHSWHLSSSCSRILAAMIERELLTDPTQTVHRQDLLERVNTYVAAYGLADAVPVRPPVA
jgi:hypothetical protein